MASTSRFERAEGAGGARVDSRIGSPAEYLAKLWTLFGAPDGAADGRAFYGVRDCETGQEFEVSTNAAGISYGAAADSPDPSDFAAKGEALEPVLTAFDALLAATPLADCMFEMQVGDTKIILGAKAGVPFEHSLQPSPPTRAEAIARAERALATEGNAMFYEWELLTLSDTARGARDLLGKLWHRWLAAEIATLDRELSRPDGPDRGTVLRVVDSALPRLVKAGPAAGVDVDAALAPHATTIDAARRAITG
jgi:hypothetical protein